MFLQETANRIRNGRSMGRAVCLPGATCQKGIRLPRLLFLIRIFAVGGGLDESVRQLPLFEKLEQRVSAESQAERLQGNNLLRSDVTQVHIRAQVADEPHLLRFAGGLEDQPPLID